MVSRLPVFILLFALLPTLLSAATTRDPYQYFFQASLGDLTEELETARDEGKQGIFVFFEMDECPFCHRMKQTILNQPEVQDYFNQHFLSLSIDVEGDIEIVDFDGSTTRIRRSKPRPCHTITGILRSSGQTDFQVRGRTQFQPRIHVDGRIHRRRGLPENR